MPYSRDLIGTVFERLTVIANTTSKNKASRWLCKCLCGATIEVSRVHLISGDTKSCGCLAAEKLKRGLRYTHGMRNTSEYVCWAAVKERVHNPDCNSYKNYGGRGIKMCSKWYNSFSAFYEDMGPKPAGMSLDRIDNNGDYEPGNCRWATRKQQSRNRRSNVILELNGTKKIMADWARELKIKPSDLQYLAVRKGLSLKEIIKHGK